MNEYKSVDEMFQERLKLFFRFIHIISIPMTIISLMVWFQNDGTGVESGAGFWSMSFKFWIVIFIVFSFVVARISKVEVENQVAAEQSEAKRKEELIKNVTLWEDKK